MSLSETVKEEEDTESTQGRTREAHSKEAAEEVVSRAGARLERISSRISDAVNIYPNKQKKKKKEKKKMLNEKKKVVKNHSITFVKNEHGFNNFY